MLGFDQTPLIPTAARPHCPDGYSLLQVVAGLREVVFLIWRMLLSIGSTQPLPPTGGSHQAAGLRTLALLEPLGVQ